MEEVLHILKEELHTAMALTGECTVPFLLCSRCCPPPAGVPAPSPEHRAGKAHPRQRCSTDSGHDASATEARWFGVVGAVPIPSGLRDEALRAVLQVIFVDCEESRGSREEVGGPCRREEGSSVRRNHPRTRQARASGGREQVRCSRNDATVKP